MKEIELIKKVIKERFKGENSGHGYKHLKRVYKYALKIQKKEGGDKYIVAVSALVHDIHRVMSNKENKYVTSRGSLIEVENILKSCNVREDKIPFILKVVEYHDEKGVDKEFDLETKIIQDADVLDALGKRGLKRTLMYCRSKNIPVVNSVYPLDCKEYIPNVNPISTCHYIYRTMIPNGENMHTKTARKMADDKIRILQIFVKKNIGFYQHKL